MANVIKVEHAQPRITLPMSTGRSGSPGTALNRADLCSLEPAMARLTVPVMTLAWKTPRRLSETVKSGSFGILIKHDQESR